MHYFVKINLIYKGVSNGNDLFGFKNRRTGIFDKSFQDVYQRNSTSYFLGEGTHLVTQKPSPPHSTTGRDSFSSPMSTVCLDQRVFFH